jgi:hypothetical protein
VCSNWHASGSRKARYVRRLRRREAPSASPRADVTPAWRRVKARKGGWGNIDLILALITGLLIAASYAIVVKTGVLEGKSLDRRLLILLPVWFVLMLMFNLIWPYGA